MEAAANSGLGLGLGLGRQRVVVLGSRKQQSLLSSSSLSINGDGVGFSSRKMMMMTTRNNNMNYRRWFRFESRGMDRIERQRRFNFAASAANSNFAQGDDDRVENRIASVLPYVGVACLGIGVGVGYLLSSTRITYTTVAANIIGTTIVYILLDKLGCKGGLPRMTSSSRLFLNVKSSDDVDTFARVIALKTAGVPQQEAEFLVEETKDLPESKFDSLVKYIYLDQKHKKN